MHVALNATATKIVTENNVAVGVQYRQVSTRHRVTLRSETLRAKCLRDLLSFQSLKYRFAFSYHLRFVETHFQYGKLRVARASREIIVSGGAVNSPQLLLLSGIGPKEHLKAMDVKLVKDLPGKRGPLSLKPIHVPTYTYITIVALAK